MKSMSQQSQNLQSSQFPQISASKQKQAAHLSNSVSSFNFNVGKEKSEHDRHHP